ncbi:hypothetical protein [Nocardia amamiensis]|uniref:hypothetical protein n=1 Tax=Nocardia amamiensis TaxID=404578 RepID=UPI000AC0DD4A|nr:hypothetical protein [Nocardia amamiensis]
MTESGYPVPAPEQVEALMNNPDLIWEDVPAAEAPPVMSEANATELLRQSAEQG